MPEGLIRLVFVHGTNEQFYESLKFAQPIRHILNGNIQ